MGRISTCLVGPLYFDLFGSAYLVIRSDERIYFFLNFPGSGESLLGGVSHEALADSSPMTAPEFHKNSMPGRWLPKMAQG